MMTGKFDILRAGIDRVFFHTASCEIEADGFQAALAEFARLVAVDDGELLIVRQVAGGDQEMPHGNAWLVRAELPKPRFTNLAETPDASRACPAAHDSEEDSR